MIREALQDFAKTSGRVFVDRANTVGASEVGQCARKIYFHKNEGDWLLGADRDDGYVEGWGAAMRGRLFEDHFWAPALRARFGSRLRFAGKQQQTFISGFLSATPDGLLVDLPRDVLAHLGVSKFNGSLVVECKTIDPRTALDETKPEHSFQSQVQLGLLRELTEYRPELALVSYTNASFLDDISEFLVKFDSNVFAVAKQRAAQIMTAQSPEELRPEGWIAGGAECEYCPFRTACGRMRHALPSALTSKPPDPQFVTEIADLARAAKQQRREAGDATARLREIECSIKERLRNRNLRRVAGDGVLVTWSGVKGRPSWNMPGIRDAAAEAGVDLSEFETVGESTDRLTVAIRATHCVSPELQAGEHEA